MSINTEFKLKAKIIDFSLVREKIKEIAKFIGNFESSDYFFKNETSWSRNEIRLRMSENKKQVTLKIPCFLEGVQGNEEYSFKVSDEKEFLGFLEKTGFSLSSIVRKKWESYKYKGITINLSEVEEIGNYIELVIDTKGNIKGDEKQRLLKLYADLGLSKQNIDPRYYNTIKTEDVG